MLYNVTLPPKMSRIATRSLFGYSHFPEGGAILSIWGFHEGGQAQTSLHKSWVEGIKNLFFNLPRQGIEPRVFGFESDALTTELHPPSTSTSTGTILAPQNSSDLVVYV